MVQDFIHQQYVWFQHPSTLISCVVTHCRSRALHVALEHFETILLQHVYQHFNPQKNDVGSVFKHILEDTNIQWLDFPFFCNHPSISVWDTLSFFALFETFAKVFLFLSRHAKATLLMSWGNVSQRWTLNNLKKNEDKVHREMKTWCFVGKMCRLVLYTFKCLLISWRNHKVLKYAISIYLVYWSWDSQGWHLHNDSPKAWRRQILNIWWENLKVFYTLPETNTAPEAHRIHVWYQMIYLPTWMADFYGCHVGK